MADRRIEEDRKVVQKEYTVTIHSSREWKRRREEAAMRKRRRRMIWTAHCVLTAALAITLLCVCLAKEEPEQLEHPVAGPQPSAMVLLNTETSPLQEIEPSQTVPVLEEEAVYIAKTIYGEARGCTATEQAAVAWCILNRVDDESGLWPDDVIGVVTQANQFAGYDPDHPVLSELHEVAMDVLERWQREKAGETDVGRVLPEEYCYFHGDGKHNYFRQEYEGGPVWNWSLESPYEEE